VAADTAYLQGGPCDGRTRKLSVAESDSGSLICGGDLYLNDNGKRRPNGDIIFKDAGPAPSSGGGSDTTAPHAHKGWADLQRSVNHKLPAAMSSADKHARDALRSLAKASRVRI
jgi:hypothetical protein